MVLLLMITLSSLKSGQSILFNCSKAEYYCPPTYECRPREQRCTESDNCTYPNNDDMCFSDGSKKSYAVRVGYARFIRVFGINLISHRFVQYRGFTYEYLRTGVEILDIVNPFLYRYRNDRGVSKFRTVGYSSCTYEDVDTITAIWDQKSYDLISDNCISFSEAMVRFLMSDKCEGRRLQPWLETTARKKKKTLSCIFG